MTYMQAVECIPNNHMGGRTRAATTHDMTIFLAGFWPAGVFDETDIDEADYNHTTAHTEQRRTESGCVCEGCWP